MRSVRFPFLTAGLCLNLSLKNHPKPQSPEPNTPSPHTPPQLLEQWLQAVVSELQVEFARGVRSTPGSAPLRFGPSGLAQRWEEGAGAGARSGRPGGCTGPAARECPAAAEQGPSALGIPAEARGAPRK